MAKEKPRNTIEIIVFLGNPGKQYEKTRHNVAWRMLDHVSLCAPHRWQRKFKGEYTMCMLGGKTIYLHKPLTFMNKSGESIVAIAKFFRVPVTRCLLVHDEVELEFGTIGLKRGGGLAGHNGLRSAEKALGGRDFYRLRIGVGRPDHGSVSSHVLGRFASNEMPHLDTILTRAAQILEEAAVSDSVDFVIEQYSDYLVI